jgi:hypothetical protein
MPSIKPIVGIASTGIIVFALGEYSKQNLGNIFVF